MGKREKYNVGEPTTAPMDPSSSSRLRSLDGLRGFAAALVVLGHARLIVVQNFDSPVFQWPVIEQAMQLIGVLGYRGVWLFFILSGLVLALMMLRSKSFDYTTYLVSRLIRLYLPVWAAVVLTIVTMLFISRDATGLGPWVEAHPTSYAPWAIASDLTLLDGTTANLSPLWTLQWEVFFSLLLAVYVASLRRVPPWVGVVLAITLSVVGNRVGSPILVYMSMFAIGTSLAYGWDRVLELRDRLHKLPKRARVAGLLIAGAAIFALLEASPLLGRFHLDPQIMGVIDPLAALIALTAAIVIVATATDPRRFFEARVFQWLGMISFSLYLVHEPILLAFVYPTDANPVAIAISLVACFAVAYAFYLAVERPSHKLAQKIRRRAALSPAEAESQSEPARA